MFKTFFNSFGRRIKCINIQDLYNQLITDKSYDEFINSLTLLSNINYYVDERNEYLTLASAKEILLNNIASRMEIGLTESI